MRRRHDLPFDNRLSLGPDALDHGDVGVERLADRLVRPALTRLALVGHEQDAGDDEPHAAFDERGVVMRRPALVN